MTACHSLSLPPAPDVLGVGQTVKESTQEEVVNPTLNAAEEEVKPPGVLIVNFLWTSVTVLDLDLVLFSVPVPVPVSLVSLTRCSAPSALFSVYLSSTSSFANLILPSFRYSNDHK